MEEYRNGEFGSMLPLDEKLQQVIEMTAEKKAEIKALHIGDKEELEDIKKGVAVFSQEETTKRIFNLEKKINKILVHLGLDDKTEVLVFDPEAT